MKRLYRKLRCLIGLHNWFDIVVSAETVLMRCGCKKTKSISIAKAHKRIPKRLWNKAILMRSYREAIK